MDKLEQQKKSLYMAILEALRKTEPQLRAGGEFFGTKQRKSGITKG